METNNFNLNDLETSTEIAQAIAEVMNTEIGSDVWMSEWENGYNSEIIIPIAKKLARENGEEEIYWGKCETINCQEGV